MVKSNKSNISNRGFIYYILFWFIIGFTTYPSSQVRKFIPLPSFPACASAVPQLWCSLNGDRQGRIGQHLGVQMHGPRGIVNFHIDPYWPWMDMAIMGQSWVADRKSTVPQVLRFDTHFWTNQSVAIKWPKLGYKLAIFRTNPSTSPCPFTCFGQLLLDFGCCPPASHVAVLDALDNHILCQLEI